MTTPAMRTRRAVLVAALAVLMVLGIGGNAPATAATAVRLSGTTTVTLREFDYCGAGGSRRLVRTYSGRLPSVLDLTDPKSAGGRRETNPFHFHFLAGSAGTFGSLELDSAQTPLGWLQQYWQFSRASNGATSGTLVDNGVATSTAINLLNGNKALIPCQNWGSYPFTFSLARGARMTGTLFSNSARLTFTGITSGGEYEFQYAFAAG